MSVFAVGAFNQTVKGTKITSAGQTVSDAMNLARSIAQSRNTPVQLRFYKLPDPQGGTPIFRGMQIFTLESRATNAVTKPFLFPQQIAFSVDNKKSSILSITEVTPTAADPAKISGASYTYVPVTFGASGIIQPSGTLTSTNEWYVTVQAQRDLVNDAAWPENYATININPVTGNAKVFQPH